MRKRGRSTSSVEYSGYVVSKGDEIESVLAAISAEEFFDRFIAARKPCIVNGHVDLHVDWSIDALSRNAAEVVVEVEMKPFGSGKKKEMLFEEFCKDLSQGYMTTQRGQEEVISAPLQNVAGVPVKLPLSGNLVCANVNMWLGAARATSTPLHVDFHDNFYLLKAGKKVLWSFVFVCF
jgi:hypothetical protein